MRRVRFFLDANIIVDAQLRDLFLTAAELEIIDVRWSPQVLTEVKHALTDKLHLDDQSVERLLTTMRTAQPGASIVVATNAPTIVLPDPDDTHVALAAILGECDLLVTNNIKDFPEDVFADFDVMVATADVALAYIFSISPGDVAHVIATILERLQRPQLALTEYVDRLFKRAPVFGLKVGRLLAPESFRDRAQDADHAWSEGSPHQAVTRLVRSLHEGDTNALAASISPELSSRLLEGSPGPDNLLGRVRALLPDMSDPDEWDLAAPTASSRRGSSK